MVKNPPAMQETGIGSLGQEDCLSPTPPPPTPEKEKAAHSGILVWEIP